MQDDQTKNHHTRNVEPIQSGIEQVQILKISRMRISKWRALSYKAHGVRHLLSIDYIDERPIGNGLLTVQPTEQVHLQNRTPGNE